MRVRCSATASCIAICLFGVPTWSFAAGEIYESIGPEGVPRYTTHPMDGARLLHSDVPPPHVGRTSHHGNPNERRHQIRSFIDESAKRHGLTPSLVEAVVSVESNFDPQAISAKGATGLMQLRAATAARYGVRQPLNQLDPQKNVDVGAQHLKHLLAKTQGNVALALAAYNAGEGSVSRYGQRIPPFRETMLYVPAVLARHAAFAAESE